MGDRILQLKQKIDFFKRKACLTRRRIIDMIYKAGSGHPGGSLSAVELIIPLFYGIMNYNSKNPLMENRDRLVFSKGHAAPLLYAILADVGFFDIKELDTLRKFNSRLQGHPDSNLLPGVECSTGSLGQGLSISAGIALAGKLDKKDYKVFTLCGDGELQEGQIWETLMFSAHYKLDNLIIIIDNNGLQIDGKTEDVMNIYPLDEKIKAFGCNCYLIDGHNYEDIINAYNDALTSKGKPTVVIGKTRKGRGVSFMEDETGWHGKAPTKEQAFKALGIIKDFSIENKLCDGNCEEC